MKQTYLMKLNLQWLQQSYVFDFCYK